MARTDAQRIAKTRHYLGRADRHLDVTTGRDVEQALRAVSAETLAEIDVVLDTLESIDADLRNPAKVRLRLQARKVGSLELPGGDEIAALRSLGRQEVGRLSSATGLAVLADVYSPSFSVAGGGLVDNYLPHG